MPLFQTVTITEVEEVNGLHIFYVVDGFRKKLYQAVVCNDTLGIHQIDQSTGRVRNHPSALFSYGSGRNVVVFGGGSQQVPIEKFLYDNNSKLGGKTLALGYLEYHWRKLDETKYDNGRIYQISNRMDSGHPHVRLTVTCGPDGANTSSTEISEHIAVHSEMFDRVVAAVLWMFKSRDPWVM